MEFFDQIGMFPQARLLIYWMVGFSMAIFAVRGIMDAWNGDSKNGAILAISAVACILMTALSYKYREWEIPAGIVMLIIAFAGSSARKAWSRP